MSSKKYTDQEKEILSKNHNIIKVGERNITYSKEFQIRAIKEHENGKTPIQIFNEADINISILGSENPKSCIKRWKKIYRKLGEKGLLEDKRGQGKGGGRPRIKELTPEEELKRAKARIAYLEAENEYLKKLEELERRLI